MSGLARRAISVRTEQQSLKVTHDHADVRGIMAEADRTPRHFRTSVPVGLLERLNAPAVIRLDEVARGRQYAAERAYDDGDVVVEIATQLLSLSAH